MPIASFRCKARLNRGIPTRLQREALKEVRHFFGANPDLLRHLPQNRNTLVNLRQAIAFGEIQQAAYTDRKGQNVGRFMVPLTMNIDGQRARLGELGWVEYHGSRGLKSVYAPYAELRRPQIRPPQQAEFRFG